MKKELTGWLDVRWEDTMLYSSEDELHNGNPYMNEKLVDQLEEFHNKKVKITIEEI